MSCSPSVKIFSTVRTSLRQREMSQKYILHILNILKKSPQSSFSRFTVCSRLHWWGEGIRQNWGPDGRSIISLTLASEKPQGQPPGQPQAGLIPVLENSRSSGNYSKSACSSHQIGENHGHLGLTLQMATARFSIFFHLLRITGSSPHSASAPAFWRHLHRKCHIQKVWVSAVFKVPWVTSMGSKSGGEKPFQRLSAVSPPASIFRVLNTVSHGFIAPSVRSCSFQTAEVGTGLR